MNTQLNIAHVRKVNLCVLHHAYMGHVSNNVYCHYLSHCYLATRGRRSLGIKQWSDVLGLIKVAMEGKGLEVELTFHHMLPKMEVSHALYS